MCAIETPIASAPPSFDLRAITELSITAMVRFNSVHGLHLFSPVYSGWRSVLITVICMYAQKGLIYYLFFDFRIVICFKCLYYRIYEYPVKIVKAVKLSTERAAW